MLEQFEKLSLLESEDTEVIEVIEGKSYTCEFLQSTRRYQHTRDVHQGLSIPCDRYIWIHHRSWNSLNVDHIHKGADTRRYL